MFMDKWAPGKMSPGSIGLRFTKCLHIVNFVCALGSRLLFLAKTQNNIMSQILINYLRLRSPCWKLTTDGEILVYCHISSRTLNKLIYIALNVLRRTSKERDDAWSD